MTKINVFDSRKEAYEQLIKPCYEKNLETTIEFNKRHELKRQEYIDVSGYGEKFRKEQEKKLPRKEKIIHPKTGEEIDFVYPYSEHDLDAHHFALPKEEHKKFLEMYPNTGDGLELMCLVELNVMGNKYFFTQAQDALLVPRNKFSDTYAAGYKSIPKLIKNVQEYLQELTNIIMYRRAKVDTSFYTVDLEEPAFSAEQKKGAKESLQELKGSEHKKEHEEMLKNPPYKEKFIAKLVDFGFKLFFKAMLRNKDTTRGLNQQEREEFERLYSQK